MRILVAMSGGVDSLVAALKLQEQGHQVIATTFITWDESTCGVKLDGTQTTASQTAKDTVKLCSQIGIDCLVKDLVKDFEENVIEPFCSKYLLAQTPNPCCECNRVFKFKNLVQIAQSLGIHKVATGHYANVRLEANRYILSKAKDEWKDQSFMLWQLPQSLLSHCVFPLGNMTKSEVKTYAQNRGFGIQATQRESFNLCFVPQNNYKDFLCRRYPNLETLVEQGKVVDAQGNCIGTHKGYPFYTIGQSKGFENRTPEKKYITHIDRERNELKVGEKSDLYDNQVKVINLNFIKYTSLIGFYRLFVKIRGKDEGMEAEVVFTEKEATVKFASPVYAFAIGQSVVMYENSDVVCGGDVSI